MARTGGHRIRCNARWLATPILLVGAAVVAFAVWFGDVPILQVAAGVAVLTGAAAVVLFDRELVLTRREHGAERAALAKEYVEMYAARLRERLHANAVLVPPLPEESALAAAAGSVPAEITIAETTAETTAESTTESSTESSEAEPVEEPVEVVAQAESETDATVEPEAAPEPVQVTAEVEAPEASEETPAVKDTDEEMWDAYDAPTVVDLIAYEVRARLAEDERKDAEAAKVAESSDSEQQQVAAG